MLKYSTTKGAFAHGSTVTDAPSASFNCKLAHPSTSRNVASANSSNSGNSPSRLPSFSSPHNNQICTKWTAGATGNSLATLAQPPQTMIATATAANYFSRLIEVSYVLK